MNQLSEHNTEESTEPYYRNWLSYISFFLACLCALGVLSYHFPGYLTTPRLRNIYDAEALRVLMDVVMHASIILGVLGIIFSKTKMVAFLGCFIIGVSVLAGGHQVEVELPIKTARYYLSLDLVVLDLLYLTAVFIPLEKIFKRVDQRVLRHGVKTDVCHYVINHLLMGGLFVIVSVPGLMFVPYLPDFGIGERIVELPILVQALLILFLTDFTQYWVHRAFHTFPALWQFHKIHHSSVKMDWLAGSRLHVMDVIVTRSISYIPVVVLGFSNEAVNLYLPIVAFQAVFVHANFKYRINFLSGFITTPLVHHWHHSAEEDAIDKNFAVSFSIIDRIFGTYHCPKDRWPSEYGLHEGPISESFRKQFFYPFLALVARRKK